MLLGTEGRTLGLELDWSRALLFVPYLLRDLGQANAFSSLVLLCQMDICSFGQISKNERVRARTSCMY